MERESPDLVTVKALRQALAQRGATLAIGAAATLIVTGLAVMVLSYREAAANRQAIVRVHSVERVAQEIEKDFWHEREAMNEYLLTPKAEALRDVRSQQAKIDRGLSQLARTATSRQEREWARAAAAAHASFVKKFESDRPAAGRGADVEDRVVTQLNGLEAAVLTPLNAIAPFDLRITRSLGAESRSDGRSALFAAVLSCILALAGGLIFGIYAIRLVRRIRAQNEQLRALDRLKDDFVASVSHELRTPLTSIRGYLELLTSGEAGQLNDEQERFLAVVDRNADRLLNVVGDLLFVSQVEAGVISLEQNPFELVGLLKESVDAARPAAEAKEVAVELSADHLAEVNADRARLAQVFDNLLSNAIKFTPAGGFVDVEIVAEGDGVKVRVSDTGMGISAEDQERLFTRFFRTAAASEQAIQGTGLGLAIVKAIVEGHGGTITVESEVGVGTTFWVELPLAVREAVAA
ncbi:MAG TPA: ATP-binding protein [Gaiellaceae bacterium]